MKKVLLSLAAVGFALTANAQLLNYGFETTDILPGELVSENWAAYENSTFNWEYSQDAFEGERSLYVTTDVTCNPWERVIAFTNTGLEENKSYRVSLWVKGTGTMNVALLKGCFNHDKALLAGNGESFIDQTSDYVADDEYSFHRASFVFWSPSREIMTSQKADFASDSIWALDFLRLNFKGIGKYTVDNVKIEEASIAGISFGGTCLRVDFGYTTNGKEIYNAAGGTVVLDNSLVEVKVEGEVVTPQTVEVRADGNLYIFLEDDNYLSSDSQVTVSFKNDGSFKYATNVAPECFTNPNCAVYDFTDEIGYYAEDLEYLLSNVYEEAALVSSKPNNESFEIDNNIQEFSFTFNKPVSTDDEENGKPEVTLAGMGIEEALEVVPNAELSNTLVFKRTGSEPLVDGLYTLTINNVSNAASVATTTPVEIEFEVGKVKVSETIYTQVLDAKFPEAAANGIPEGWTVVSDGEVRTFDNSYGSGGRTFDCTGGKGIYTRANGGEGSVTSPLVEFPAGDLELRLLLGGWSNNSEVTVALRDSLGNEVLHENMMTEVACEGIRNNGDFKFPVLSKRFTCPGGEYQLVVTLVTQGYNGIFYGGFEAYTYVETEGTKVTSTVYCDGDFAVGDDCIPAYGTGWRIHNNDGRTRKPGAHVSWGGDNEETVCGGGGSRVFNLGLKGMTKGMYLAGGWNATYGEFNTYTDETDPENPVDKDEKVLDLKQEKVQVSYSLALWKENANGTVYLKIYRQEDGVSGEPVYSCEDLIPAATNVNGNKNANLEPYKVQFSWKVPEAGKYILRFESNCEALVGNVKVEKPGSTAALYHTMLNEALAAANEELELAMADDNYAGTTRETLASTIAFYTNDPDIHSVAEYNDAIAELAALVKKMKTRRENVDAYLTGSMAKLVEIVETYAGTKYEQLDAYVAAVATIASFNGVSVLDLDDETLAEAVASINGGYDFLNNLITTGVPLTIKQLAELADMLCVADSAMYDNEHVILAGNAIYDNQSVVAILKTLNTAYLYKKVAAGFTFGEYNEEAMEYVKDSIDVTYWIQNNDFYCVEGVTRPSVDAFPGWEITVKKGVLTNSWDAGWDPYAGNANNPILNAKLKTAYGETDIEAHQLINTLPVGTYTMTCKVADDSNGTFDGVWKQNGTPLSQVIVNGDSIPFDLTLQGNYRGEGSMYIYDVEGVVAEDGLTATIDLVANPRNTAFATFDNVHLYWMSAAEGFDYAAAADKLLEIAGAMTNINLQTREDAPAEVIFYNLNGQRVNVAEGACIKVERYSDGYTVVKTVFVK